jgi:hypothetical protein
VLGIMYGTVPGMAEKVRHNRLRRAAQRQGYVIRRSPVRDPNAVEFGRWAIDRLPRTGGRTSVTFEYELTTDELERFLTRNPAEFQQHCANLVETDERSQILTYVRQR